MTTSMSGAMSHEANMAATRRVTARLSMIGIPIAMLVAAVVEFLRLKPLSDNPPDIIGGVDVGQWYGLVNDRTLLVAAGLIAVIAGLIITLVRRAWRDVAWSVGGVAVLCASLAGYLWSLPGAQMNRYRLEFDPDCVMGALWAIAALVVAVSLYRRGLCLNASMVDAERGVFYRCIGRRVGVFLGAAAVVVVAAVYETRQEMFAAFTLRFLLELIVYTLVCMAVPLGIATGYWIWSVCERSAYLRRNGRMVARADAVLFWVVAAGQVLLGLGLLLLYVNHAKRGADGVLINNTTFNRLQEALAAMVSFLSVVAVVRLVAVLCTVNKARAGATVIGWAAVASQVLQWGQTMLYIFLVNSNAGGDGIRLYSELVALAGYVNFGILLVRPVALIVVAAQLRRVARAGAFVFALPAVQVLQWVANIVSGRIVGNLMDFAAVYVGMGVQSLIGGIIAALFYVAVPVVLGRVRLPEERLSGELLNKEDFLVEI